MEFWQNYLAPWLGNPDLWSALTAIGTIALAAVTYAIIRQNQTLIQQNRQDQQNTEIRHRDQFKPILVFVPRGGAIQAQPQSTPVKSAAVSSGSPYDLRTQIFCAMQNIGTGPALHISLRIHVPERPSVNCDPVKLPPLGPGQARNSPDNPLILGIKIRNPREGDDFAIAANPIEISLRYQDIFGRHFKSVHQFPRSDTANDGRHPSVEVPWFTYHELGFTPPGATK